MHSQMPGVCPGGMLKFRIDRRIMKTKNSEKRALFSIKYSRGALSIVDKIENWKNTKKKTTSVDEKEKDEVKLHAALVLNITYWVIYEPRRDT